MKVEQTQDVIERIGKALHVFHGSGYCSQGHHNPAQQYKCWDEAKVVIEAINDESGTPREYPAYQPNPTTLAERVERAEAVQRKGKKP